jgi:hypothetical protein
LSAAHPTKIATSTIVVQPRIVTPPYQVILASMSRASDPDLRARLVSWDFPLGPFRDPADIEPEMQRFAAELGPAAAPDLADLACALSREHARELDVCAEFLAVYAVHHPTSLAAALLARLGPAGPPLLVEALGPTRSPDAAPRLLATLDLAAADEELLVCLACALGELGDPAAIAGLHALAARDDIPSAVRDELEIALHNLHR